MESFFRYVSYVDYYKKSEKIKNVGFLRWKLHNAEHQLELQVKNLYGVQGNFEIREKSTGKIIGNLYIDQGIGCFREKFSSKTASGNMYIDAATDRLYLDEVEGFIVWMKEGEYLDVDLVLEKKSKYYKNEKSEVYELEEKEGIKEENNRKEKYKLNQNEERDKEERRMIEEDKLNQKERIEIGEDKLNQKERFVIEEDELKCKERRVMEEDQLKCKERRVIEKNQLKQKEKRENGKENQKKIEVSYEKGDDQKRREEKFVFEKDQKKLKETKAASKYIVMEAIKDSYVEQDDSDGKEILERKDKKIKIIEPVHDDKWQQLCKKYQKVHPFSSNKVFLSIKPEDFIILQQEYQKLVNNSFLLHGFYNYGHMILGKLSEEEKAPVYIGVPGVYYEREKQAARMFGFSGFESTEHPVQAGSYGYYMIEVEI